MKHKDKQRRHSRTPGRRKERPNGPAEPRGKVTVQIPPRIGSLAAGPGEPETDGKDAAPPSDQLPFDARFFRRQFPHLLAKNRRKANDTGCVVSITLGDGSTSLDISHVEQLGDEWALLAVYDSNGFRPQDAPARFVFVPYGSIARVEVTGAEARIRSIGFAVHRARGKTAARATASSSRRAPSARRR